MSQIFISKTCDRIEFTSKILSEYEFELKKAKKVFVKPNIVSYESYPTTTHPEILKTILKRLSNHEVIVGDAPAFDAGRSNKIIANSPLKEISENYGAKYVNLYSDNMKTIKSPRGYKLKVSTLPLSCDYVISIPILKSHFMVGLSGALKNQFGYLSKQDRLLMHAKIKNLDKGIAEVNAAIPTNLFIVDAVETMITAQERRHGGHTSKLGYMMAGNDPVALDYFGLQILKKVEPQIEDMKQKCLLYIKYSESIGLGTKEYKIIEV
jgi:uncharacterized protein (DUF362 family)